MKLRRLVPLMILPLPLLTACGGGSTGSVNTLTPASAVSIMITDAFNQKFSKVWVNIQKVTVVDANGQTVTLYDNPAGLATNLTELNGVAALLNTQSLANGTYSDFKVTVADAVTLVDAATAQVIDAAIAGDGLPQIVNVMGQMDINGMTTVTIDFDLKQFSYDPATKLVTPMLVIKQTPDQASQHRADIHGQVTGIIDGVSFTILDRFGMNDITVILSPNATVIDALTGTVVADTSAIENGQTVSVSGAYDANTMTVTARRVEIKANSAASGPLGGTPINAEIEGVITEYQPDTGILTVDVKEASFIPGAMIMDIDVLNSNPVFSKGSLNMLTAGQKVELKGDWQDPDFTPAIVEVEGGQPHYSDDHVADHHMMDEYVEVQGLVDSVGDNSVSLTVQRVEGLGTASQPIADTLDVNFADAMFKYGSADCLEPMDRIEVKGALLDDGTFDAQVVEIDDKVCALPTMSNTAPMNATTGSGGPVGTGMGTGAGTGGII